jgi:hypothetical protein
MRRATASRHGRSLVPQRQAESCGSNVHYVRAAILLRRSENSVLLDRVLRGHVSLLAAASQVQRFVDLIAAYRAADVKDHIASFRALGPERLFDEIVQAVD